MSDSLRVMGVDGNVYDVSISYQRGFAELSVVKVEEAAPAPTVTPTAAPTAAASAKKPSPRGASKTKG